MSKTSTILFTPIYGGTDEGPLCSLVEIDGYKILLDCGWNDTFDLDLIKDLEQIAPTVDAVLLSHSDLHHIGALPYIFSNFNFQPHVKIYSTLAVQHFGQIFLYDVLYSHIQQKGFNCFTEDEIDNVFSRIKILVYSQTIILKDSNDNETPIEISAYNSGHDIGGTIWKIRNDIDDIIYAVDFNHSKDHHLNPTQLETLTNPSILICDAFNATTSVDPRVKREKAFFDIIMSTLRNDRDVLIPTDTAGRVLELLFLINRVWTHHHLQYPVIFLSNTSDSTVSFARSHLEWMNDSIVNKFTNNRENGFDLKYINTCISVAEMETFKGPRVILATMSTLNTGFSLDLIKEFSEVPDNVLLFTERGPNGSLSQKMQVIPTPSSINIMAWQRVPLNGKELEAYRTKIRQEIEEWETKRKKEIELRRKAQIAKDREYEGEDVESSSTLYDLWQKHDLFVEKDTPFQEMGLHPMFPYLEKRSFYDEFGEVIKIEDMNIGNNASLINNDEIIMEGIPCPVEEEIPTKPKLTEITILIQCQVKFIDFEGRSDGESLKRIIKNVSPRKLCLIHGNERSIETLNSYFQDSMKGNVHIPSGHLTPIDLSSGIRYTQINLKDEDLEAIQFVTLGDYSLAYINGQLRVHEKKEILPEENGMEVEEDEKEVMELIFSPNNPSTQLNPQNKSGVSGLIGNVKLSEFRQLLMKHGFQTKLRGGVLEVNEVVIIKKEETGHEGISVLKIDGQLCDDYYKVRDLMYSSLTAL